MSGDNSNNPGGVADHQGAANGNTGAVANNNNSSHNNHQSSSGDNITSNPIGDLAAHAAARRAAEEVAKRVKACIDASGGGGSGGAGAGADANSVLLIPKSMECYWTSQVARTLFLENCKMLNAAITDYGIEFDALKNETSQLLAPESQLLVPEAEMNAAAFAVADIVTAVLAGLPAIIKEVSNLFRLEYTFSGGNVNIPSIAFQASVVGELRKQQVKVVYPNANLMNLPADSAILTALCTDLVGNMKFLRSPTTFLPDDAVTAGIDESKTATFNHLQGLVFALETKRESLYDEITKFVNGAVATEAGPGSIDQLIMCEQMQKLNVANVLAISIVSAGASKITATGPFRTKSPLHTGSANVQFSLYKGNNILDAGTIMATSRGKEALIGLFGKVSPIKFETCLNDVA